MYEASGAEKEFWVFVADGVDLCEIALVVRCLVDETAAAEDLDVIDKTLQQGIVGATLHISVVTQAAVRPDHLRECVFEPFREAVRLGCELDDVHEVAELRCAVTQPLCTEAELRIYRLDVVTDLLKCLCLIAAGVDILYREFTRTVPVRELLGYSKLVIEYCVSAVCHGSVCPLEEHVPPLAVRHVGDRECACIIVSESGSFACELVVLCELSSCVVAVHGLLAVSVHVPVALTVYKTAVVVKHEAVVLCAVVRDSLLPCLFSALCLVDIVVRIAVVHTVAPPAEGKHCVAAYALSAVVDAAGKVCIFTEVFAILVLEDDSLPACHLLYPLRHILLVPPCVHPLAVDVRSFSP